MDGENKITLPYKYTPRDYQEELWRAAFPGQYGLLSPAAKRFVLLWHRRAGKDKTCINLITAKAFEEVGNYLYMLPEQTQARKVIWKGIGKDGMRFIDHIPHELIARKYEREMLVELINGSSIQLGGSDAYDSWMGTNPRGIIFSEYSVQNPLAWNYFRPILTENEGWAVFIYTARGHNHGYQLVKAARERIAKHDPDWFLSEQDVTQTKRDDGTPVITQANIQAEIDAGMPPEMVRQEFYNSFDVGMMGAYYADIMEKLYSGKPSAIGHFPHDPHYPVITAWDIGIHDATSIWFVQNIRGVPRVIDYYEVRNESLAANIKYVLGLPYNYVEHLGPHDLVQREKTTAETLEDFAFNLGLEFTVIPKLRVDDGIEQVRALLPQCIFHEEKTSEGLEALLGYERIYDEKLRHFRDSPTHNWASHGADAFRTLAVGWIDTVDVIDLRPAKVLRSV